jgi:MFS family permease
VSSTFRSVRGNRNAKLFFSGLLASNIGTWAQFTATAILVDRLTGKATAIGILSALQFGPMLVLGAWAGAIADRLDRRRMTIVTQSALAAQAVALAVLDLTDTISIGWIYALTLILGIVAAFDNPARRGFVTELVPEEQIANIVSLNTAVMTGSRIFGPAITALLVGTVGTAALFTVNAASFIAILVPLFLIDTSRLYTPPRVAKGGTPVRDGLRYVRRTPIMLVTFIVFAIVSTFGFNYNISLPRMSSEIWGSEQWYGWLLAANSLGSLLGSLATASREHVTIRWMAGNGFLLGFASLGLAWSPDPVLALFVSIPVGLAGAGFVASMNAITQQECPPVMRGRILGLSAVAFLGSYPIGGPITGIVGDQIGLEWSLGYGAVITIVTMLGLVWWALGRQEDRSRFAALRSMLAPSSASPSASASAVAAPNPGERP